LGTIVASHIGYVLTIANKYRGYCSYEELVSEGYFGLIRAAELFDVKRDVRFVVFASYHIRSKISEYVLKNQSMVGGGAFQPNKFFKVRREFAKQACLTPDRVLATEYGAASLGMPLPRYEDIGNRIHNRDLHLDCPIHEDSTDTMYDYLVSQNDTPDRIYEEAEYRAFLGERLSEALQILTPRQRRIVESHILGDDPMSFSEIVEGMGITRQCAQLIYKGAIAKLRRYLRGSMVRVDRAA
jgi:RNA polymerase sigma-32 factor